jgi:putative ABC transport system substrate-binding protein
MSERIRRREFITLLGGVAGAWPVAVRAQKAAMPAIAYISSRSASSDAQLVSAFRVGLNSGGYFEGKNVTIEFQLAEGQYDRLPGMMADAVARRVALILAPGTPAGLAAKAATSAIPVLFNAGSDPIEIGLVNSLSRRGGNMTGVLTLVGELALKDLGILHELLPHARNIAILSNPESRPVARHLRELENAAHSIGLQLVYAQARTEGELEATFETIVQQQAQALLVVADPFLFTSAQQIVALAARHALPAMYFRREFADAGGLISYGSLTSDSYRQLGVYASRILNGERPADLPVAQPTKFELVINLKTAKTLGVDVPNSMQLLADEVIE